ncbi:MAG: hypothetical protein JWS10_955 [Cypionkella sp.]|uniref:hypothetical protein n=1 Tax=Cypionkella sp. TaxID=2811411 RepID=UPI00262A47D3|nr:hypothetical protein [Cypionkella sp.]MDB5658340.1 hypothetical protein [Cypionkella sp.]
MSREACQFSVPVYAADRGSIGQHLAEAKGKMDDMTRFTVSITHEEVHLRVEGREGACFVVDINVLIRQFGEAVEQVLGKKKGTR